MEPFIGLCGVFAVSLLFIGYEKYHAWAQQRKRVLRERVAYMLWVMANAGE